MQDTRGIRFRGFEIPGHDRAEGLACQELAQEVVHGGVDVACADALGDGFGLQVLHQGHEARLRDLREHGAVLGGVDFPHGGLLLRHGERGDVLENVSSGGDA